MYLPHAGAFREAVHLAFSVIDNPPAAEETDRRPSRARPRGPA